MKRILKTLTVFILACVLISGGVLSASAAGCERVIYFGGNCYGGCSDGRSDCGFCPQDCESLYDILKSLGLSGALCGQICSKPGYDCGSCDNTGCGETEPGQSAPSDAPAQPETQPAAEKPTSAPEQKPTETPAAKPTEAPAVKPTEAPATKPTEAQQSGYSLNAYEAEVVELINDIRAQYGLGQLSIDTELSRVARIKSQDMRDKGYFSHQSPTYGSPFDMMTSFGIKYRTAGENIAMGYRTPESVVDGWMNSEGHRKNILNGSFTRIGMGYVESGNYWTQMFTG